MTSGEDDQEGRDSADESAKVRETGRHGRSDVSQRGFRAVQSPSAIQRRLHLRKSRFNVFSRGRCFGL